VQAACRPVANSINEFRAEAGATLTGAG